MAESIKRLAQLSLLRRSHEEVMFNLEKRSANIAAIARILVIGDEQLTRELTRCSLSAAGYEVLEVSDGRSGLQLLEAGASDLAIIDIVMPEVDGIEIIRTIRHRSVRMPIIAISGSDDGAIYLRAAMALGATTTLSKPFRPAALLQEVIQALKGG